jgi:hypothetical protein
LSEDEIKARLDEEIRGAVGYASSELSDQRKSAQEAYYGQPYGNEVEGRSSYVSRDVAETIEWIMPSLMRVFTGGDNIVKFEPQGPEDEKNAQQATDYINYIFQRENQGFLTLYTWFKDALLFKNGFVKVYWEEYTEYKNENYENLTDDEFAMILQQAQPEVLEHTETEGPQGKLHAVKLRTNEKSGKCCIVPIPPEEVLVSKNPIFPLHQNRFRAHRRRVTISELKQMGFEDVDDLADNEVDFNQERIARFAFDETDSVGNEEKDKASREVWLAECFLDLDVDGDGIAEERTIIMAGNKILQNEEGTTATLISITPIPLPHKLYGMSEADLVLDLQLLKSTVFRQILDNMYLANNGRYMALDGMVNIDDLLTSRPGGIVRVKTFDAVKPMQPPLLGAPAFNLLEYIDTIKENRTGVTRYNQGIDADSLNKTASGINQIMSASQQRTELIARVFAETGVKDLFYAILENVQKHQDKAKVIRLRNEWVQMDPREWKNKFDLTVMVGLGTGSKEMQLAALNEEAQFQLAALEGGLPVVTPENVYNLRMKALEAKNIKGGDLFYTHPSKIPPKPPQQDPAILKAQIDGQVKAGLQEMKNQAATEKQAMKQQFDGLKEQFKAANALQMQREQQAVDVQKQREQSAAQAQEADKGRQADSAATLIDLVYDKKKNEEDAVRGQQQEELKAILQMLQDNTATQNKAILAMVEASLAERETEVAERDSKGKVKKTRSRVVKNG